MGRLFVLTLEGKIYSCKHCRTHLALCEDIVSKSFHCRHGKAYLFSKAVNVTVGETEERMMTTGLHTVADIFCVGRLPMRRARSTRKENLFLSGIRFQDPMEATTGPAMKHMWAEVMQMMFDYAFVPICAFLIPQFPLFDLWIAELVISHFGNFT